MSEKQPLYLKHVVLEDYRSIQKVDIDFMPGLNIIIGENGSGKTNFLDLLRSAMSNSFTNGKSFARCQLTFKGKAEYTFDSAPNDNFVADSDEGLMNNYKLNRIIKIKTPHNDGGFDNESNIFDLLDHVYDHEGRYLKSEIIRHGLPIHLPIWNNPLNGEFRLKTSWDKSQVVLRTRSLSSAFSSSIHSGADNSSFIRKLALEIGQKRAEPIDTTKDVETHFRKSLNNICEILLNDLRLITKIEDIRCSSLFSLEFDSEQKVISFRNFFCEFKFDGKWLNFDQLSDGTKRIIYLVSETINYHAFISSEILFLEEPELGIHPHQLHKLMTFLKEESEDKQIILTTHSPQVLNVLGVDELDRVLICEYDAEKGTQLRHMTDKEKKEAATYMEEVGFFSDYWLHADFNRI